MMFPLRWIIPLLVLVFICVPALAGPVLPAEYYGTVTINGAPAPAGTVITALINDQVVGTVTTTVSGTYGGAGTFDPRLVAQGTGSGEEVRFQINGRAATQTSTFASGTTRQLTLSAEYSPGSTGVTTTAVPATSVATTIAPGVEQTLLNPWTPDPTRTGVTVSGTATPTTAVPITQKITTGATLTVTTPQSPVAPQPTLTEQKTMTIEQTGTPAPPTTTPASPGLSFGTMALLGILMIAGAVVRK